MKTLLIFALDFGLHVLNMTQYLKEEGKEFFPMKRVADCGTGICFSLRLAANHPKGAADYYHRAQELAEEFQYLMELMVRTKILTEIQSQPLLSDCHSIMDVLSEKINGKRLDYLQN
jgi:hypothetical protein